MKPKTTLVLLLLLVLAALGVGVSKWLRNRLNDEDSSTVRRVFPDPPSEARKLTLTSPDAAELVFVRSQGRWNMTQPKSQPAQSDLLDRIVREITGLQYRRALPPEELPDATAGLDSPRWTVTIEDDLGQAISLHVGRPAPNVGSAEETYVRPGGERRTLVVPRDVASLLDRDVKDYRDRAVLSDVQTGEITAVRVEGRQTYALVKDADGWRVRIGPATIPADADAVARWLTTLTGITAERFLAEHPASLAPFGLARPQLVVHITACKPQAPSAETYTLLVGNRRGKSLCAMVQGRPTVFSLPQRALEELQPTLASLESKDVLAFDPSQADRVTIRTGETKIVLQKTCAAWSLAQPFVGPAEDGAVEELLDTLSNLRAEAWIAPHAGKAIDIRSPSATITVRLTGGAEQTLRVGTQDVKEKVYYVQPAGATAVAKVAQADVKELLRPANAYWSRELLSIPDQAVVLGLTIDRPDGAYVLARQEGQWRLVSPVAASVDAKDLRAILQCCRSLRAEKIVSLGKTLSDPYAKAKNRITVSLTFTAPSATGGKTNARFAVVRTPKGYFAWRTGEKILAVGRAPDDLYETLLAPLTRGL